MKYRTLGKTGWEVSEIGHGTWAMGFMWGPRDDRASKAALRCSLEGGVNFLDTALQYGRGHSERLIGQVLRETKLPAYVATKCMPDITSWPPAPGTTAEEAFSGKYLIAKTEESLTNLGVECLDLQQLHVWRSHWLSQGDWLEAVERLKSQGKIRRFGVSLCDHEPDDGLSIVESGLIDTVQVIFNLFDQTPRNRLFLKCQEYEVGVLVRVPLDEGGLAGTFTTQTQFGKKDWRKHYFAGDRLQATIDHGKKFAFLQRGDIRDLAQAALKFCLSEPAVSTVLSGMRQIPHVEENLRVPDLAEFSLEELARAHDLAWPRNYYGNHGW